MNLYTTGNRRQTAENLVFRPCMVNFHEFYTLEVHVQCYTRETKGCEDMGILCPREPRYLEGIMGYVDSQIKYTPVFQYS